MDSWLDFILLVFASLRLTRLIVYDKITDFIRRLFHSEVEEMAPDGRVETYIEIKGSGLRYWIGELLSCHWCTGFWSTLTLYLAYKLIPTISLPVITVFAIAGCASFFQYFLTKE
ncbi:DUF1360 domain-containing protein [Neobacillus terrae]|uniref:DUF1360 domain-containing protein n=1 Tax=Neobacillus terrae TaxID=3034837 RepID=UPI00140A692A|nr:DUF1360 domain-containing protein [Neobacillus terrae]NHM32986.1 DUF1360 domain-containing protein [Neobacillus terrae]